jgi:hypothetical protein
MLLGKRKSPGKNFFTHQNPTLYFFEFQAIKKAATIAA